MAAKRIGWADVRDLFRAWREEHVRKSDEVVELWETTLSSYMHKLGDECWMVYEQVAVAAFDCNRLDVADICLVALANEFPGSMRVRKLKAMKLEAQERYDDAIDLLDSIIKRDETNSAVRKRKIAILKAQGKTTDAIKELTEYLKKFMSDQEGWLELCDMYLSEQDYSKAAFCMEELVLHNPHNHLYHQRYAEVRYTQGGVDNMELAKAYFCQAVKLNSGNMRALFGVFLSASHLSAHPKTPALKKKEYIKLATWAAKQIAERYKEKTGQNVDHQISSLEGMMGVLQITAAS